MASLPTVYYAQGLAGKRWHLYASWSKLLPSAFLDKWAARWPARRLWQDKITCGQKEVLLEIYGGPAQRLQWFEKLASDEACHIVASTNLPIAVSGVSLLPGRMLLAVYLRRALYELSQQVQLQHDRLSFGLVARGQEMHCWLANIEGLARQVTVVTDHRSRLLPLSASGLAPRQLGMSVAALGVDILIVAPEFLPWLCTKEITPGTVVLRTDGVAVTVDRGVKSISLDFGSLFLPAELLAEVGDFAPLQEAIILAAHFGGKVASWPTDWSRRLMLVQQAVNRSEWPVSWRLISASVASAG